MGFVLLAVSSALTAHLVEAGCGDRKVPSNDLIVNRRALPRYRKHLFFCPWLPASEGSVGLE